MEKSYLFTSHAETTDGVTTYDRALTASQMRAMNKALIGSGVYADPATTLKVSATSGMTVSVAAGKAWVEGAYYELDEAMTFTVTTASGTNKRIDTLVLRFDDSDETRAVNLVLVTGTADAYAAPTAPVREGTTYDIVLAQITVAKGVTSITAADIKDTRFDNDLCGQVTGVLNQITTTGLFTQYQGQFETWFANIKNQLSTDAAGNLQAQIDVLNAQNKIYSTKPASPVAGDLYVPTDGYTEEEIYNGSAWIKRYPVNYPAYSAWRSSDTVKNGQQYDVVFNASDAADDNCSLSSGQVLISQAGSYLLDAGIFISDNAQVSDIWRIEITVLDNSTTALQKIVSNAPASAEAGCYMHTCGIATIPAGKKIKIAAVCAGSGGSFRVAGGSYKTYLRVQKL